MQNSFDFTMGLKKLDFPFSNMGFPSIAPERTLLDISLEKRLKKMMHHNFYLSVFEKSKKEILERTLKRKKMVLSKLPAIKLNPNSIKLHEYEISEIKRRAADIFMKTCFSEEEMLKTSDHLMDPMSNLTKNEHEMLKIGIAIRLDEFEGLDACFGPHNGVFQALLCKNTTDLTNLIGGAFKEDPSSILKYALMSCQSPKGFNKENLAKKADMWAGMWLDKERLKLLLTAKEIKLHLPPEEARSEKWEREKIRRYQSAFKATLLDYLKEVPPSALCVFRKILPFINRTENTFQDTFWKLLFQKLKEDPEIQGKITTCLCDFLKENSLKEAGQNFYHTFVKYTPAKVRAEIIGHFDPKTLKRYCSVARLEKSFINARINIDGKEEYLNWYLFNKQEIPAKEMISLLKTMDLKKDKEFIFCDKKVFDKEIFQNMAEYFSKSKISFWRWIKSFEQTPNFKQKLAEIYPSFSEEIKQNPLYLIAMTNHFDLVRQCALCEDTGSLSILKKILNKELFWHYLTKTENKEISGFSFLCRQGKRGLLKLIADLPLEKQQALFQTPGAMGIRPLDLCPDKFLRMVEEKVFQQQYTKKETVTEEIEETKEDITLKQPKILLLQNKKTEKSKYPRQVFRLPYFEKSLERQQTIPGLSEEVEKAIQDLTTMSGARIQAELREGWKKNGRLEKLAVKNIRGNQYRLGYCVQGDADKNQGKIAFLFLWTHAQYNSLLNKQGQQLVRQACALMGDAAPALPIPTNAGNDGR